jgi:hypothetical protein
MAWQHNPEIHVTFDGQCGLYLAKLGHQRDNFRYAIRHNDTDCVFITFQASPQHNPKPSVQRVDGLLVYTIIWKVAEVGLDFDKRDVIYDALTAYSNPQPGGFAKFIDGEGLRAQIQVEYVDRLEGF